MSQLFYITFDAGPAMDPGDLGRLLKRFSPRQIPHLYLRHGINFLGSSKDHDSINNIRPLMEAVTSAGVKPVLLLKYTCMGDHHLTGRFQKNLGDTLSMLMNWGLSGVMVSDLYLAGLFCCPTPPWDSLDGIELYISDGARINRPIKANYLDNLPFVSLTAHHDLLADISQVARLARAVEPSSLEIPINRGCMASCPVEIFCRAEDFHREQEGLEESSNYPGILRRWLVKSNTPAPMIPIIFPSGLQPFLNAGVAGFRLFNNPDSTEGLEGLLEAYFSRRDSGDLSKLDESLCRGIPPREAV